MSSKFHPRHQPARLPVVCRPRMAGAPNIYPDGWPAGLDAYGNWDEPYSSWVITETFRLTTDLALPGWSGKSGVTGTNLAATVKRLVTPDHYTLVLILRSYLVVKGTHYWPDIHIPAPPPFNSPLLRFHSHPPQSLRELQVLG